MTNGRMHTFEVSVEQFNQLRYSTAKVFKFLDFVSNIFHFIDYCFVPFFLDSRFCTICVNCNGILS